MIKLGMKRLTLCLLFGLSLSVSADTHITAAKLSSLLEPQKYSVPATVESLNQSELSAEISAKIIEVKVRIGDLVKKDEVLIRLDCRHYQSVTKAQLAIRKQLSAQRKLASSQLSRALNLKSGRTISKEDVERRESEVASLNAQVESQNQRINQAQLNVERCQITAPFTGIITRKISYLGSLASPGTPLLELVQLKGAEVNSQLREDLIKDLASDQVAEFLYAGETYPLTLRRLLPVVNKTTRTRAARFIFQDDVAPVGAAGRVIWWQQPARQLPAEYLVRRNNKLGIFLLRDNKAFFHPLERALEGQPSMVSLPADSMIIINGRENLQHDGPISLSK